MEKTAEEILYRVITYRVETLQRGSVNKWILHSEYRTVADACGVIEELVEGNHTVKILRVIRFREASSD